MKAIVGVIFLVFAILIGFSYLDKYFYATDNSVSSSYISESSEQDIEESIKVCVTLTGEVLKEGKYYGISGSFLNDFIEQAGGLSSSADQDCFDIYFEIEEDLEIYIPKVSDDLKVSINDASVDELDELPGIGQKTAAKIVAYRIEIGSFSYLEQLMDIDGIGKTLFNKIKDSICL